MRSDISQYIGKWRWPLVMAPLVGLVLGGSAAVISAAPLPAISSLASFYRSPATMQPCFSLEVSSLTGSMQPGPGGAGTFVTTVENPNPAATCDNGLAVMIAFPGTPNPITSIDGGPDVVCSDVPVGAAARSAYAGQERCLASSFAGGTTATITFSIAGISKDDRLIVEANELDNQNIKRELRQGGVTMMELSLTAPAAGGASVPANPPAPGNAPAPAPSPAVPASGGAPAAPAAGNAPAAPSTGNAPAEPSTGSAASTSSAPAAPSTGNASAPSTGSAPASKPQAVSGFPTVSTGEEGVAVTAIQYLLRHHGSRVPAEGAFDAETEAAVREFQQKTPGLTVDGIVGPQTWGALLVTLKRGDKGEAVSGVQHRLNWEDIHIEIDGDFGPQTEAGVIEFQQRRGMTADGIVGPQTWRALVSAN